MIPILAEKDRIDFVYQSDLIKFIILNSTMEWNEVWDIVKNTIFHENISYYIKTEIKSPKKSEYYTKESVEWVGKFFDTHPWLDKVMFVYDN